MNANRLSTFSHHVATLAGGAVLVQLIPLLAAPILTRLYTPEAFGLFALYLTWLSNLAVIATGRYELAIILPKKHKQAYNLMGLSLAITTGISIILLLALIPTADSIAIYMQQPQIKQWLLWLPLSLLLAGGIQIYTNWNNRQQHYRQNAIGRTTQAIFMTLTQLGCAWIGLGATGLLIGQLTGQFAGLLLQTSNDLRTGFSWRKQVSVLQMKKQAYIYREFPLVNLPNALITALQDTLTIMLLTFVSGSVTVGLYGLMMRVLKLPAALIGQAIAQVTYRDMAEAKHTATPLYPIYYKTLKLLLWLSLPPAIITLLFGGDLFALVFGANWREAGKMAAALSPYMLCHFIVSPLGMIPLIIQQQRTAFMFSAVGNLLFLSALAGGFYLCHQITLALWLVSAVMVVYFISYFYWLYRAITL